MKASSAIALVSKMLGRFFSPFSAPDMASIFIPHPPYPPKNGFTCEQVTTTVTSDRCDGHQSRPAPRQLANVTLYKEIFWASRDSSRVTAYTEVPTRKLPFGKH